MMTSFAVVTSSFAVRSVFKCMFHRPAMRGLVVAKTDRNVRIVKDRGKHQQIAVCGISVTAVTQAPRCRWETMLTQAWCSPYSEGQVRLNITVSRYVAAQRWTAGPRCTDGGSASVSRHCRDMSQIGCLITDTTHQFAAACISCIPHSHVSRLRSRC